MNRRRLLDAVGATLLLGVAGCSAPDDVDEADTGLLFEGRISGVFEEHVDVVPGITVAVEANGISPGERLEFNVGGDDGFVHRYTFDEDDSGTTNEYTFETDGRHQLVLQSERYEEPVDEAAEILIRIELREP